MRAACESAAIAESSSVHPRVDAVLYPGLSDHPEHAIAARQMHSGFGGMLSIRCHGGAAAAIKTAAQALWKRATSLGSVESLIEHQRQRRSWPGTPRPDDLLRPSVGIEDPEDLLEDLDRALRA